MLLNTKEKETGVKFNPGLSANWPSNNRTPEGTKKFSLLRTQTYFRTFLLSTLEVTFPVERSDDRIRLQRSQAEILLFLIYQRLLFAISLCCSYFRGFA